MESVATTVGTALEALPVALDAYVFGSVARGDDAPHSDVDVAVWLDDGRRHPEPPWGWRAVIAAALMSALGRNDVDVVVLNEASPLLYHRVLRDGVRVLSRDPAATNTREGRALSRWCDWAPVQERIDQLLSGQSE